MYIKIWEERYNMQNLTRFLNERKSRYQKKICRAKKQEKQAIEVLKDEPDRQDVREDLHKVINIQCRYKALIKLIDEIQETLKEYEDLGLEPKQIREIDKLYAEQGKELGEYKKAEEALRRMES